MKIGDWLLTPDGTGLHVTRIDVELMFSGGLLTFVEDSPVRWPKLPIPRDADVEILTAPGTQLDPRAQPLR